MKIETGYYIFLDDAIDVLSLFEEKDPDGFIPQQVVQMVPRIWLQHGNESIIINKRDDEDLSKKVNLCNCEDCIHNEVVLSARNRPYNHCLQEDVFMRNPKIEDFKCTKFISKQDGLEDDKQSLCNTV